MSNVIKVFNHKPKLEDVGNNTFRYYRGTIESNAIFLEETLEKLLNAERYWKQKYWQKKDKPTKDKLKDIQKGINEVFEKADKIWKDIAAGKQLENN
jgi:hypothetical protein